MKFSRYNHHFEHKGKHYVYNMFSTSLIELDERCYTIFANNNLTELSNDEISQLTYQGMIVDSELDEAKQYNHFYENSRYVACKNLSIIFVPTYGCNLACPYCYEGQKKECKKISYAEIDTILAFVKQKIENPEPGIFIKRVACSLFGGEPLLCLKELKYFCEGITSLASQNNLELIFSMTSNFTLVNDEVLEFIRKYNITTQVTIDGTRDEHDTRRISKDGKGTYDIILHNLRKANEAGLKELISIRLNIDTQNLLTSEEALLAIKEYAGFVYFGLLHSYNDINKGFKHDCLKEQAEQEALTQKLYPLLEKYNLYCPYMFGKKSPCVLSCQNKYVIDCNLDVYSCGSLLGHKKARLGYLKSDGTFHREPQYYEQMNYSPFNFEKCRNCKWLPMCGGSCTAASFLADNEHNLAKIVSPVCAVNEDLLNIQLRRYVDHLAELQKFDDEPNC